MEPRRDFSFNKTAQDMQRLEAALRKLMAGEKVPGLSKRGERKLLDIACGRADETGVLRRVFGGDDEALQIIGADIRDREIAEANERWADEGTDFLVHDGTRLHEISEMDGADLALLRHQNYWNGKEVWEEIFSQTAEKLNDEGLMVITSYFDREHSLAKKALADQGMTLVNELRNAGSRATGDIGGKSVDRWLAVFRKG